MSMFRSQFFLHPGKLQRWLQHVSFWLLLLGLRFYLTNISFNVYGGFPVSSMLLLNTCSTGVIVLFYYTLVYYLWPKYFTSHQYIKGVLMIFSLLVVYTIS